MVASVIEYLKSLKMEMVRNLRFPLCIILFQLRRKKEEHKKNTDTCQSRAPGGTSKALTRTYGDIQ